MQPYYVQSALTKFLTNAGWSVSAELVAKVFRLTTLFALAWVLSLEQYGLVMLSLVLQDIIRMLMRCGSGPQVVQCSKSELLQTLYNGIVLQWILCSLLVIIQMSVGWFASKFYQQPLLFEILWLAAPVYLVFPIVSARVFTITRNNNIAKISTATAIALSFENCIIACSAFFGAGVFSVVFGKYAFAIIWLYLFLKEPTPSINGEFSLNKMKAMFTASCKLVASESAKALKMHTDLLIAGRILSPELLGLYSIARNASIGISQSFVSALDTALFPYLCDINRAKQTNKTKKLLSWLVIFVSVMAVIQSLLVPFYLPMLFGAKWSMAIDSAIWLCYSVIPIAFIDLCCSSFRSLARFKIESVIRCYALIAFIFFLQFFEIHTPLAFAKTMLLANIVIGISIYVLVFVERKYGFLFPTSRTF